MIIALNRKKTKNFLVIKGEINRNTSTISSKVVKITTLTKKYKALPTSFSTRLKAQIRTDFYTFFDNVIKNSLNSPLYIQSTTFSNFQILVLVNAFPSSPKIFL